MTANVALVAQTPAVAAFGTSVATLASTYVDVSSVTITPPSPVPALMKISFNITGETGATAPYLGWYVMEQGIEDTALFGDGTVSGATQPAQFPAYTSLVRASLAAGSTIAGNTALIEVPPVPFKIALVNGTGYAFTAAAINITYYDINTNS